MDYPRDIENSGPFEARYLAFLETIAQLRPRLHRYCSRMTGSALDGEDLVQDALFEAYRKLDQFFPCPPLSAGFCRGLRMPFLVVAGGRGAGLGALADAG